MKYHNIMLVMNFRFRESTKDKARKSQKKKADRNHNCER